VLGDDGRGAGTQEHWLADHQLISDESKGIDVASSADLAIACGLLGTHVLGRADDQPDASQPPVVRRSHRASNPEIREHRSAAAFVEEHILGFHVAVDDALRMGVREGRSYVHEDAGRSSEVRSCRTTEQLSDALSANVLHHEIEMFPRLARSEDSDDSRMSQLRDKAGFEEEPVAKRRRRSEVRADDFDGDWPVESEIVRQVYPTHGAFAEDPFEHVLTSQRAVERVECVVTAIS
jgi:hypothetical protein